MRDHLRAFAACLLLMLPPDAVWLFVMGPRFYTPRIGHLLADEPFLTPAAAFYLLYALGVAVFVVVPAGRGRWPAAAVFGRGAFLGLLAYGTYDLTNHATMRGWPLTVTLVDLVWGACLTGAVAAGARWAAFRSRPGRGEGAGTP